VKHYAKVSAAMTDIRHDYLVEGKKTREIRAKYLPRRRDPF